jgi:hypothetical protein
MPQLPMPYPLNELLPEVPLRLMAAFSHGIFHGIKR